MMRWSSLRRDISFFQDAQLVASSPLKRPVTDCSGHALAVGWWGCVWVTFAWTFGVGDVESRLYRLGSLPCSRPCSRSVVSESEREMRDVLDDDACDENVTCVRVSRSV